MVATKKETAAEEKGMANAAAPEEDSPKVAKKRSSDPERPVRIPLGQKNVLTAPKRKGYVRRFVNDTGGRVKDFEAAGYKIVTEKTEVGDRKAGKGTQIGSVVMPSVGSNTEAVLMEIKEEWYTEDQETKHKSLLENERSMKRNLNKQETGVYGGYPSDKPLFCKKI